MDVPLYPIIVTVVEECTLEFKKTIVSKSSDSYVLEYPKIGIALFTGLLFFVIYSSANSKRRISPKIEKPIIIYNIILFFCNLYAFFKCIQLWLRVICWSCEYEDMFSLRISSVPENVVNVTDDLYIFFMIKILELFDVIFAVLLRKNETNLRNSLYQHITLILVSWICCKYFLDSYIALLFMSLNSTVDTVKYVYYESSIVFQLKGMWSQQLFKKFMKLITMVQHAILGLYVGYLLVFDDNVSELTPTLILLIILLLLYLIIKH